MFFGRFWLIAYRCGLMADFLQTVRERVVIYDGAMGTSVQLLQPTPDDFWGREGCNEVLALSRPDLIRDIHAGFLSVGCDVIETDTFGATRIVLQEYSLETQVGAMNQAAAQVARAVAGLPVTISYRIMPTENISEQNSGPCADMHSGAIYWGVPRIPPDASCRCVIMRAMPKSITMGWPADVIMILAGLMSRCITPRACAQARPSSTPLAMRAAFASGSTLSCFSNCASVKPST